MGGQTFQSVAPLPEKPDNGELPGVSDFWLLSILAGVFFWRLVSAAWVNLIPDECSYWTWSRYLDWSYFDNSPMVAYLIRLSTALWGESTPFTVRFPFLFLSFWGTWLVYKTSVLLFGSRRRALLAVAALNVTPLAALGGAAAMHDNVLTFCWIAAMWACARWVRSHQERWFCVMGIAGGLAMLGKYTGVLLLPAILLFLVWNRDLRGRLASKGPWIGIFLAFLFTLPILWWNYHHNWASFYHILFIGSGSSSCVRRFTDGLGYHLGQFGLVSPLIYLAVLSGMLYVAARNVVRPRLEETLLLSFSLPLLLFGIMAYVGHVEANWAAMAYPAAVVLCSEEIFAPREERHRLLVRMSGKSFMTWSVVVALGMSQLVVLHGSVGLLPAAMEERLGKADRVIWETAGWKELGAQVGRIKRETDVIAGDSYQMTALLWFNVPGQQPVRYLAPWKRPTEFDVMEPSFGNLKGQDILYVSSIRLEPSSPARTTVYDNFRKVTELPAYEVIYHGVPVRRVFLYRCEGFDPDSPRKLGPRSLLYRDY